MTKQKMIKALLAKFPDGQTIKRKDIPKLIGLVWDEAQKAMAEEFRADVPDFMRDIFDKGEPL